MTVISFKVEGTPAPQGSKSARSYCGQVAKVCPNCHKPHLVNINQVESSKLVKPWRKAVAVKARSATGPVWALFGGPVTVKITFILLRPKGHYRTGKYAALLRPDAPELPYGTAGMDVDKLARAALDSMTDVIYGDDSQVTELHVAKIYADLGSILVPYQHPGAFISVTAQGQPTGVLAA